MIRTTFLLLITSLFVSSPQAQSDKIKATHESLVEFYKYGHRGNPILNGSWLNESGWDTTTVPENMEDFNEWYGLTVKNGKLVEINLSCNNVHLRIDKWQKIEYLTDLKKLVLHDFYNADKEWCDHLGAEGESENYGVLPPGLFKLTNLEFLAICSNNLLGIIPREIGMLTKLEYLDLSGINFKGEIINEITNLKNLKYLSLESQHSFRHLTTGRLEGEIPIKLGNLKNLEVLNLRWNRLTGELPKTLGNLKNLKELRFSHNLLNTELPSELGNLKNLEVFDFAYQESVTGAIPRSFWQLESLKDLVAGKHNICMPSITEFIHWWSVNFNSSPTICSGAFFNIKSISDQSYSRDQSISLQLIEATSSETEEITVNYSLSPSLPTGLNFDSSTRTIAGTPTEITTAVTYTYKSSDSEGFQDSLKFKIQVVSPVSTEPDELPDDFTIYSNYPNPFQNSTNLVFDLPYPAQVGIELLDVMGRQVFTKPPAYFSAGRGIQVNIDGSSLPSGSYLYRLIATTSEGDFSHMGQLVKIR